MAIHKVQLITMVADSVIVQTIVSASDFIPTSDKRRYTPNKTLLGPQEVEPSYTLEMHKVDTRKHTYVCTYVQLYILYVYALPSPPSPPHSGMLSFVGARQVSGDFPRYQCGSH